MGDVVRPMTEDDRGSVALITAQAFNAPKVVVEQSSSLPVVDRWVLDRNGAVVASLAVHRTGQFFGGTSLPAGGLAGVAVAPEARGGGAGKTLVTEVLRTLAAEGVAVSSLFPSTMAAYRRVGYESAGTRTRLRMPVGSIPRAPAELSVEPLQVDDFDEVEACYRRFARRRTGLLDRPRNWWKQHVFHATDGHIVHGYVVRGDERAKGYVVFSQVTAAGPLPWYFAQGDAPFNYDLACRDLVWEDGAAARSLLAFLAGHRAVAVDMTWTAPVDDPTTLLFEERQPRVDAAYTWMLRLVDVEAALCQRAYPADIAATVSIDVRDPSVPGNNGVLALRVEDGRARRDDGDGRPPVTVGVGALAAVYSGHLSASQAAAMGLLEGASGDIAVLERLFAGPRPWMPDMF